MAAKKKRTTKKSTKKSVKKKPTRKTSKKTTKKKSTKKGAKKSTKASKKTTKKKSTKKTAKKTTKKKSTKKTAKKTTKKKSAKKGTKTKSTKKTAKKSTKTKTKTKSKDSTTKTKTKTKSKSKSSKSKSKKTSRSVPPPSGGRRIPMPGTKAPDFTLESSEGGTVTLSDHKGQYVVVYFYPKDDTPGCTREAQAFSAASRKLKKLNTVVYGISKDSIASHCKFRDKYSLNFALLSDPDLEALQAYGAWGEKKRWGRTSMGIIRSTFVIGPDRTVIQAWPTVRVDGHVDQVLAVIADG